MLTEFLREHKAFPNQRRKIEAQEATIAQLKSTIAKQEATSAQEQRQIEALISASKKVSAQLEAGKFATGRIRRGGPAAQVVNNP